MIVGLATPTLVESDGIGNDVMGMFYSLRANGHYPKLFAVNQLITEICYPLANFDGNVDVLIYHHSINCPEGIHALNSGSFHKIVKYHNITPVDFFPKESLIRRECELGFEQNKEIVKHHLWVDSDFNGKELRKIKSNVEYAIVSPFTQAENLVEVEPDYQSVISINDWNRNILMVGRISPNKNIILAIETFAMAINKNSNMRLILVGDDSRDYYSNAVRTRITELKLHNKVIITGKITLPHLKALYLIADALLVTSLHEGFCVPLVEAMALNLPIVSGEKGALEETLGGAGVVVKNYNPDSFAAGLDEVLTNSTIYRKAGKERYLSKFHSSCISKCFLDNFNLITRK